MSAVTARRGPWALAILLLLACVGTNTENICRIRLLGDTSGGLPQQSISGASCSCRDGNSFWRGNTVALPLNEGLVFLCIQGFSGDVPVDDPFQIGITFLEDSPILSTGLFFSGPEPLVLDGAANGPDGWVPLAANLDLQNNGLSVPLLKFSDMSNLVLRNLHFRNLTTAGGPLILLEGCNNVTLQNVTFEDVWIQAAGAPVAGGLVAAVKSARPSRLVNVTGVVVRRVRTDDGGGAAVGQSSLLQVSECTDDCVIADVSFDDIALADGWAAVAVKGSPGARLEDVKVSEASCAGGDQRSSVVRIWESANGAISGSANVALAGLSLSDVHLTGGCSAVHVSSEVKNVQLRDIQVKDSSVASSGGAVVLLDPRQGEPPGEQGLEQEPLDGSVLLQRLLLANVTLIDGANGVRIERRSGVVVQDTTLADVGPPNTDPASRLVWVSESTDVTVSRVEWRPGDSPRGPAGWISLEGGSRVVVEGVRSVVGGALPAGAAAVAVSRCWPGCAVRDVAVEGMTLGLGASALVVDSSEGVQISRLRLLNVEAASPSVAVLLTNTANASISDLTLSQLMVSDSGNYYGLHLANCSDVSVNRFTVDGFRLEHRGSALQVVASGLALEDYQCDDSSTAGWGSCLAVEGSTVTLVNGSFRGNTGQLGGAVYLTNLPEAGSGTPTELRATTSVFRANTAINGGAVALRPSGEGRSPSLALTDCHFMDNMARTPSDISQRALGGDVYLVDGSSLFVANSSFTRSTAGSMDGSGGSIFSRKARVDIVTSNFTGCMSKERGGALYHEPVAGQICPTPDSCGLTLRGCRFENNIASDGGAVLVLLNDNLVATLNATNCTFKGNNASTSGGAVAVVGNCMPYLNRPCALQADQEAQALTQLQGCRFEANNAQTGGALCVTYHRAQGVDIDSCVFTGNNGTDTGAAYLRAVPLVKVQHSTFTDQTSKVVGALTLMSLHSHALIHNTTFRNNVCNRGDTVNTGSALYAAEYDGVTQDGTLSGPMFGLTLTSSVFEDNFSGTDAGAATFTRCNALIEDVVFRNNSANRFAGALLLEQDVGAFLVAIMANLPRRVTNATLRRVRFETNRAATRGGAMALSGWHVDLDDVRFTNNAVQTTAAAASFNAGGAMAAVSCPGAVLMREVTFADNSAFQGGALYLELCSVQLENTNFMANIATGSAGAVLMTGSAYLDATANSSAFTLSALNTTFSGNRAGGEGGALKAYWTHVHVTACRFLANRASTDGGAVQLEMVPPLLISGSGEPVDAPRRALFAHCEVRGNAANNSGGGFYLTVSAAQLIDCDLDNNTAGNGFFSDNWSNAGGGLHATSCTAPLLIGGSQLQQNAAVGRGGAIALLDCTAELVDSDLNGNVARVQGGAVAAGHRATGLWAEGQSLSLHRCNLTSNTATLENGGAIAATSGSLALFSSRLVHNTARQNGGAVYSSSAARISLSNSTLADNRAGLSGGALRVERGDLLLVDNTTVARNTATDSGGGIASLNVLCTHLEGLVLEGNTAGAGGGALIDMAVMDDPSSGEAADSVLGGCPAATTTARAGKQWIGRLSGAAQIVVAEQANAVAVVAAGLTAASNNATRGAGGALLLRSVRAAVILDDLQASRNTAGVDGGAVAVAQTRSDGVFAYVTSSSLYDNTAGGMGGALALDSNGVHQQAALVNCSMRANLASRGGAVGFQNSFSVALHGCTLEGNTADSGAAESAGSAGGSIYALGANWLVVDSTTISDSLVSRGHGGGIYAADCGAVLLADVQLLRNSARGSGGGAYLTASGSAGPALVVVTNSNVSLNEAGNGAAGGQDSASDVSPYGWGGALYMAGKLAVLVHETMFGGNTAGNMGGAVAVDLTCRRDLANAEKSVASGGSSSGGDAPAAWAPSQLRGSDARLSLGLWGLAELPTAFNRTLQALGAAALEETNQACWPGIFYRPTFWGNLARDSGGAVYAKSPHAQTLVCDTAAAHPAAAGNGASGGATPGTPPALVADAELAALVEAVISARGGSQSLPPLGPAAAADENGDAGSRTSAWVTLWGRQLPGFQNASRGCFRPGGSEMPASTGNDDALAASAPAAGSLAPNRVGRGYGNDLATTATQMVLSALTDYDMAQLLSNSANETTPGSSENTENSGAMTQKGRLLALGRRLSQEAAGTSGAAPGSLADITTTAGANESASAGRPLWLRRAVLQSGGLEAEDCRPGQECHALLPPNVAIMFNVSMYDALGQLVNDTAGDRFAVRASVSAPSPGRQVDLLGNPTTLVGSGVAFLSGLRVRARAGNYTLRLDIEASRTAAGLQQVPSLSLNVTVPRCSLGEISLDGGFLCSRCSGSTFSMDVDTYDESGDAAGSSDSAPVTRPDGRCVSCPGDAVCPGGAVVVPQPGYWHSAANSTAIHKCLNPAACRDDGDRDAATAALVRCQERWYAYFGAPSRWEALARDGTGGEAVVGAYLEVWRNVSAFGADGGGVVSPLQPGGVFDGFLLECALWGLPSNHTASYMQRQCAPGYAGNLCATCAEYEGQMYALNSDLNCGECFNVWQSALIAAAIFVANTAWLAFSVLLTFLTDYQCEDDTLPAADLLKVLIVHFQFFVIVTRLNLAWPSSVAGLQVILGSITGSVKQVYSPSCMWPGSDAATSAAVQVLWGLLLPIGSVLVVMALWTIRYFVWNQSSLWRPTSSFRFRQSRHANTRRTQSTRMDGARDLHITAAQVDAGPDSRASSTSSTGGDVWATPRSGWVGVDLDEVGSQPGADGHGRQPKSSCEALGTPRRVNGNPSTDPSAACNLAPTAAGEPSGQGASEEAPTGAATVAISLDETCPNGTEGKSGAAAAQTHPCSQDEIPAVLPGSASAGHTSRLAASSGPAADEAAVDAGTMMRQEEGLAASMQSDEGPKPSSALQDNYLLVDRAGSASRVADRSEPGHRLPTVEPHGVASSQSRGGAQHTGAGKRSRSLLRQVHSLERADDMAPAPPLALAHKGLRSASDGRSLGLLWQGAESAVDPAMQQVRSLTVRANATRNRSPPPLETATSIPRSIAPAASGRSAWGFLSPVNSMARSEANSVAPEPQRLPFFKSRESLAAVDHHMSLLSQIFLVLMVTSFVLMPSWATEALSIFSCFQLDDGEGSYPENQRATWHYGYWLRNMDQECYAARHLSFWVPVGVVSFVVLCLTMPLICLALMVRQRYRLAHTEIVQVYGFLYRSYKRRYYYWETITQAQTLLLVVVDVFGRTLPILHQALLLEVVLLAILMINTFFSPIVHDQLTLLQLLSFGTICMTVVLGMFTSSTTAVDEISEGSEALLGGVILAINCALILGFLMVFFRAVLPGLRRSTSKLVGALSSGRLSLLRTLTVESLIRRLPRWSREASGRTAGRDGKEVPAGGKGSTAGNPAAQDNAGQHV